MWAVNAALWLWMWRDGQRGNEIACFILTWFLLSSHENIEFAVTLSFLLVIMYDMLAISPLAHWFNARAHQKSKSTKLLAFRAIVRTVAPFAGLTQYLY